jgi:hypothetical protein
MYNPTIAPQRKRKRAPSDTVINPLSHPPDTLKQFTLAGYPADQPLPSKAYYPGFPHRAPRPRRRSLDDDDENEDDDYNNEEDATPTAAAAAASTSRRGASDADIDTNPDDADIDTGTESGWRTTDGEDLTDGDNAPPTTMRDDSSRRSRRKSKSKSKSKPDTVVDPRAQAYQARVGWLTVVIQRCLAEGDVAAAKRAFGLLARARVYGRKVDLRRERLWEMGAEVLMREGEGEGSSGGVLGAGLEGDGVEGDGVDGEGMGGGGNGDENGDGGNEEEKLARLKAYYEYLIQQYPYSKQHVAHSANSALDFHVALFSAEMEAAYAAQKRGLARLQQGEDDEDGWAEGDAMDVDEPMDYSLRLDSREEMSEGQRGLSPRQPDHLRGLSRRERRLREKEDELRLSALRRMTDIAQRMDTAMETVPFSRDHELFRLRAMVALYIGDLYVPPAPRSKAEDRDGRKAKQDQREKARGFLRRIKEGGGELKAHDEQLLETLASDDDADDEADDDGASVLPMFSSMGV